MRRTVPATVAMMVFDVGCDSADVVDGVNVP